MPPKGRIRECHGCHKQRRIPAYGRLCDDCRGDRWLPFRVRLAEDAEFDRRVREAFTEVVPRPFPVR